MDLLWLIDQLILESTHHAFKGNVAELGLLGSGEVIVASSDLFLQISTESHLSFIDKAGAPHVVLLAGQAAFLDGGFTGEIKFDKETVEAVNITGLDAWAGCLVIIAAHDNKDSDPDGDDNDRDDSDQPPCF